MVKHHFKKTVKIHSNHMEIYKVKAVFNPSVNLCSVYWSVLSRVSVFIQDNHICCCILVGLVKVLGWQ